jgi:hypothetical protein
MLVYYLKLKTNNKGMDESTLSAWGDGRDGSVRGDIGQTC